MIEAGSGLLIDFTVVTLGAFTVGMFVETLWPAREYVISISRWLNNGGLALLAYACNHLLGTWLVVLLITGLEPRSSLTLRNTPIWVDVTVTFFVLELSRYALHIAMHKVPFLWRFHAVHHADNEVDVSTSYRHHPIEAIFSALPLTVVVWMLASGPQALVIYRTWDLIMAVWTHTNVEVPSCLECWLRRVLVTPAFHRPHHLADRRFTDSNYGSSLPWFDYFFSTYQATTAEQQKCAQIGLKTHTANEQRLDGMLWAPLRLRLRD